MHEIKILFSVIDHDDHLSEGADGMTDDRGFFTVKGANSEWAPIDARLQPYLLIKHTCANAYKPLPGVKNADSCFISTFSFLSVMCI